VRMSISVLLKERKKMRVVIRQEIFSRAMSLL
jgi:hypothetical protein